MYRVGMSTCDMKINDENFEDLLKNNITDIELSACLHLDSFDNFDMKAAKRVADKCGINIWSLHLPFFPFEKNDISSTDQELRDFSVKKLSEIVKKGLDLGIDKFVIHPSGEPIEEDDREERRKCARESLSLLADVAEKGNGIICAEDLPRTCIGRSIEDMKFLTAEDERIKICFDTNHITIEKPEEVILALGEKIVTLHVSDFDFVNERHWLPGEGKIEWNKVLDALKAVNYNGVWMYEISLQCPKTILRERDLTPFDFRRNADELFVGKKPTVFSTPKPNLGIWE